MTRLVIWAILSLLSIMLNGGQPKQWFMLFGALFFGDLLAWHAVLALRLICCGGLKSKKSNIEK